MITGLKWLNLLVRFILEICMLIAIGYWGVVTGNTVLIKILLGVLGPVVYATIWGFWMAPKAKRRLKGVWFLGVELVLFGSAIMVLYATGQNQIALIFALVYLLNRLLLTFWKQT
ncbi:MAG: hypothetical protein CVU39_14900 [Chloroflexi bacterium HGW-Chloroflexi-10]|nr:MAG: hypothetical protein CVU39_14900 [Chloroflexi bacterium HGW-Chloroflexi-10]